ncbi:MAG: type II toxin-antitoxin system HicB family antitoxin [Magnetococcales bacterium]|nr:type II toxin-antitoxin system HicB family antitoxin [Magnetococcales bacterium]MBF0155644.1 type II toxin-antitoxin system HicB family antitoxin [Magnetococcales bacterium]
MTTQTATKIAFPVAIEPGDEDHAFGVVVPDLPGCFSAGDTLEEALERAREAITLHMEGMVEEKIEFQERKSMAEHQGNPDFAGWIWGVVDVDDVRETHRSVRVNITMSEGLLKRIDSHAAARRMTRSGLLAEAARRLLG